uniref:Uncharacterized protein n=1 Tax=Meloidogyne enterolobii TaxID=390850 RepID=A0A6V7YA20_MELEN|nr:unnamed protein product [Meloidogyne enterolobii]
MSVTDLLTTFEIITIIFTIYSILVSTPIYVSVLVYIRRLSDKPPFNSPFFTCFVALGIIDWYAIGSISLKNFNFGMSLFHSFNPMVRLH